MKAKLVKKGEKKSGSKLESSPAEKKSSQPGGPAVDPRVQFANLFEKEKK